MSNDLQIDYLRLRVISGGYLPARRSANSVSRAGAGVRVAWVAGDEVYGRGSKLQEACKKDQEGYVLAVPVNFTVTLPSWRKAAVSAVAPAERAGKAW